MPMTIILKILNKYLIEKIYEIRYIFINRKLVNITTTTYKNKQIKNITKITDFTITTADELLDL